MSKSGLELIRLSNQGGVEVELCRFGARIVSIKVPLDDGKREITVGFDSLEEYQANPYFGAIIGRTAGRIQNGECFIKDSIYHFDRNEGLHTLHGGKDSFESQFWRLKEYEGDHVSFSLLSPHDTNGYPGNIEAEIKYTLTEYNEISIEYFAETDQPTLYNPTNHVYFNLSGNSGIAIDQHELRIPSWRYRQLNRDNTAKKDYTSVKNTPFDFRRSKPLVGIFRSSNEQLAINGGLNHPFILESNELPMILSSGDHRVSMIVLTTSPSVVIYTTGKFESGLKTKTGKLTDHGGLAIEAQIAPGDEEKMILNPDQSFYSKTIFKLAYK